MKAPIVSTKHINQFTEFNVLSGTVTVQNHAKAVHAASADTPAEVTEGSVIKALYLELWLQSDIASALSSFVVIVEKSQSNLVAPSLSNMSTLNSYGNKKNILFTSQGLLAAEDGGNPTPVYRGWIKIPKGKQRFGFDDELRVAIAAIGTSDITGCSFGLYKEYR